MRKLPRRLGPQVVDACVREVIGTALRERRFRPPALRSGSTVAEADIGYPTDAGLAADAVRVLARAARRVRALHTKPHQVSDVWALFPERTEMS